MRERERAGCLQSVALCDGVHLDPRACVISEQRGRCGALAPWTPCSLEATDQPANKHNRRKGRSQATHRVTRSAKHVAAAASTTASTPPPLLFLATSSLIKGDLPRSLLSPFARYAASRLSSGNLSQPATTVMTTINGSPLIPPQPRPQPRPIHEHTGKVSRPATIHDVHLPSRHGVPVVDMLPVSVPQSIPYGPSISPQQQPGQTAPATMDGAVGRDKERKR
jgi:hypothetical protein